jgi:hypothetical protein
MKINNDLVNVCKHHNQLFKNDKNNNFFYKFIIYIII